MTPELSKKQPGSVELKDTVYYKDMVKTKELRVKYTKDYLSENLISSETPESFLKRVVKFFGGTPSDDVFANTLWIQAKIGLPKIPKGSRDAERGFPESIDVKFGDYTLGEVFAKLDAAKSKILKKFFQGYHAAKRKQIVQKNPPIKPASYVPPQPKPQPTPAPALTQQAEVANTKGGVAYVGDSHVTGWSWGRYVKELNGKSVLKHVKGGMQVRWMNKEIRKNIKHFVEQGVKHLVLTGGANNASEATAVVYNKRPIERDPVVKFYIKMRKFLAKHGITFHITTIPPLGGYVKRKYERRRKQFSGSRKEYWMEKHWGKHWRQHRKWIKKRYGSVVRYYTIAEPACHKRWLRINRWILAHPNHIDIGHAQTVFVPKRISKDGIHITSKAEQKRIAARINRRFAKKNSAQ